MQMKEFAKQYQAYTTQLRRKFHQYPEEGRKEKVTCNMICQELRSMGLEPKVLCDTGVIVDIGTKAQGQKMACIRADMDGLQIQEETGVPYSSRHVGYMHACGHDAHMAMALTAARILKEKEELLKGCVRILFEPGEENSDGALDMIKVGALDGVNTIYGTHIWAGIPSGKFSVEEGPRMAACDMFRIVIHGKSTHGSLPQMGIDSIMAAAVVLQNIKEVIAREFSSEETALVSFCQIHGGSTDNTIPDTVTIGGTTRTFLPEVRERIPQIMEQVIREATETMGARGELQYGLGSPAVINHPECSERARKAVEKNFGPEDIVTFPATTGGEDFSEYLSRVPGVFVFLGIDDKEAGAVHPNHSSRFNFDESILWKGAAVAAQYCVDFLDAP